VIPKASNRLDLLFPVGVSLVLSTAALLVFPGFATVACEFLVGLLLIGFFVLRTAVRYLRERGCRIVEQPSVAPRSLERSDLLLLLGFAAIYASVSGVLARAGWPLGAVRSCAFLLLIAAVLLKPRLAASHRWPRQRFAVPDTAPPAIPLTTTSGEQDGLAAK
jgi:hypothetical protein